MVTIMTTIYYQEIWALLVSLFVFLVSFYICWIKKQSRPRLLTDWPVVGMLPGLVKIAHHGFHEAVTEILKETGGTFFFRGPCFAGMDMIATSDTANIHYILSRNFSNYPKGPDFNKMFGGVLLGDGIFNSDSRKWEIQRKMALKILHHNHLFLESFLQTSWDKVQNGLIPLLEQACRIGSTIDLQYLFQRYTFDTTSIFILGHDPASLAIDAVPSCLLNCFSDAEEAVLFRHVFPEPVWRLQRFLGVGKERKLTKAFQELEPFIAQCMSRNREKDSTPQRNDLITCYMKEYNDLEEDDVSMLGDRNNFLRDGAVNFLFAGRSSVSTALTWFFWLVATNPLVETKIRQEMVTKFDNKNQEFTSCFRDPKELGKLVYLHGAICEALRLYPPIALQHKAPVQPDILPSGERVESNTRIILSFYSMARMETIWGSDCLEFKPERWIREDGSIIHQPSSKFTAFNAGPRTCLGKDITFVQMKIVATALIHRYHFHVVDGHHFTPSNSVVIQMRDGLKVRASKMYD